MNLERITKEQLRHGILLCGAPEFTEQGIRYCCWRWSLWTSVFAQSSTPDPTSKVKLTLLEESTLPTEVVLMLQAVRGLPYSLKGHRNIVPGPESQEQYTRLYRALKASCLDAA